MAKHRQTEGGLGNEHIAWHEFERGASRVRRVFVIAGRHDAGVFTGDCDLGRTQHMPGGVKFDGDAVEPQLLAIGNGLRSAGEVIAVTQAHHVQRLLRRQHRAMA